MTGDRNRETKTQERETLVSMKTPKLSVEIPLQEKRLEVKTIKESKYKMTEKSTMKF